MPHSTPWHRIKIKSPPQPPDGPDWAEIEELLKNPQTGLGLRVEQTGGGNPYGRCDACTWQGPARVTDNRARQDLVKHARERHHGRHYVPPPSPQYNPVGSVPEGHVEVVEIPDGSTVQIDGLHILNAGGNRVVISHAVNGPTGVDLNVDEADVPDSAFDRDGYLAKLLEVHQAGHCEGHPLCGFCREESHQRQRRGAREIEAVLEDCREHQIETDSRGSKPGLTFEDGVEAALGWVLKEGGWDNPLDD